MELLEDYGFSPHLVHSLRNVPSSTRPKTVLTEGTIVARLPSSCAKRSSVVSDRGNRAQAAADGNRPGLVKLMPGARNSTCATEAANMTSVASHGKRVTASIAHGGLLAGGAR